MEFSMLWVALKIEVPSTTVTVPSPGAQVVLLGTDPLVMAKSGKCSALLSMSPVAIATGVTFRQTSEIATGPAFDLFENLPVPSLNRTEREPVPVAPEQLWSVWLITNRSSFPSKSRSTATKPTGATPAMFMVDAAPNPPFPSPLNRLRVLSSLLATTTSILPSLSKSPTTTALGLCPVEKVGQGEPDAPQAVPSGFLKVPSPLPSRTEKLLSEEFTTTRSCLPSPFKSATPIACGAVPTIAALFENPCGALAVTGKNAAFETENVGLATVTIAVWAVASRLFGTVTLHWLKPLHVPDNVVPSNLTTAVVSMFTPVIVSDRSLDANAGELGGCSSWM